MELISQISFDTLVSFHKLEGQEELTYLTILFTVIVGIIGFLGSAQKIDRSARFLILLFYVGLHFTMVSSFLGSMEVHSALHKEIKMYAENHPHEFLKESPLLDVLKTLEPHNTANMKIAGYLLLVFVVLCILSVGENKFLDSSWLSKKARLSKKRVKT